MQVKDASAKLLARRTGVPLAYCRTFLEEMRRRAPKATIVIAPCSASVHHSTKGTLATIQRCKGFVVVRTAALSLIIQESITNNAAVQQYMHQATGVMVVGGSELSAMLRHATAQTGGGTPNAAPFRSQ